MMRLESLHSRMRAPDCISDDLPARPRSLSPPALPLLAHAAFRRYGGGRVFGGAGSRWPTITEELRPPAEAGRGRDLTPAILVRHLHTDTYKKFM